MSQVSDHQKPCIYMITNRINGQRYIGSTVNLRKRWVIHLSNLSNGKHPCKKLQADYVEHGKEVFETSVLEEVSDEAMLLEREQYWIDTLGTYVEYNSSKAQIRNVRDRISEEHKRKISEANKGAERTAEHRRKISESLTGRKQPADLVEKRAVSLRGKVRSPESRERYRQSKLGTKAPACKLTEKQVLEIRLRAYRDTTSNIARDYGISPSLVSMIKNKKRWAHI